MVIFRVHQSYFQVGLNIKIQKLPHPNRQGTLQKGSICAITQTLILNPATYLWYQSTNLTTHVLCELYVDFGSSTGRYPQKITQFCIYSWLSIVLNLVRNIFSRALNPGGQLVLVLESFQVYKEDFASSESVAVFSPQHPSYRTVLINDKDRTQLYTNFLYHLEVARPSLAILPLYSLTYPKLNIKFTMERPSFDILPPELRCMIYLFATPPRYVYLRGRDDNPWLPSSKVYFTSGTHIPSLLHTCRESRNYLIKQGYELTFRTPKCEQRTWFSYNKDILIVPRSFCVATPPISDTIVLSHSVDACRLYDLRVEDKDRIRWLALCSHESIHCLAQLGPVQWFEHQAILSISARGLEPRVWSTSCLSCWPDPHRNPLGRV